MRYRKPSIKDVIKASGVAMLCTVVAAATHAGPPSSYSVNPQLNGLNVSYYVKKTDLYITLFAFNHEKFPVLCDAQYHSGPDKTGGSEQLISPEQGADFRFRYGRGNDKGQIDVQCVKPATDNVPAQIPQHSDDVTIQDLSVPHAH